MKRDGMTLLELLVSVSILSIVAAMLFVLSSTLGRAATAQDVQVLTQSQARFAMQAISRDLRQASLSSMSALPAATLSYRVADDLDGNGTAVNVGGFLELSPVRSIGRDTTDANNDGRTVTQLVLRNGARVRVLANDLLINEDTNNNGVLDAGEDRNGNRVLDRGLWLQRAGGMVQILIQTQRQPGSRGNLVMSTIRESVAPRNP